MFRGLKNWFGRETGYGCCYHCKDTWNWKEPHNIAYNKNSGMFPLCEKCFCELDRFLILIYCENLMTDWGLSEEDKDKNLDYILDNISKPF